MDTVNSSGKLIPSTLGVNTQTDSAYDVSQDVLDREATAASRGSMPFSNLLRSGMHVNTAYQLAETTINNIGYRYYDIAQAIMGDFGVEADPSFNFNDHYKELEAGLTPAMIDFVRTGGWLNSAPNSLQQAYEYREQALQTMRAQAHLGAAGFKGIVAMLMTGVIDVDAPLMFASGGSYLAGKTSVQLARMGMKAGRTRSAITGAVSAGEAGVVFGAANASTPAGDWTDIPNIMFSNLSFGGALGGITKYDAYASVRSRELATDFNEQNFGKVPVDNQPIAPAPTGLQERLKSTTSTEALASDMSLGASLSPGELAATVRALQSMSPTSKVIFQEAQNYNRARAASVKEMRRDTNMAKVAATFKEWWDKSPLAADYTHLSKNGDSTVGTFLAHKLFEDPAAINVNSYSAARIMDDYEKRLMVPVNIAYKDAYNSYATKRGFSILDRTMRNDAANAFHLDVMEEMASRRHGGRLTSDPDVKAYADALDNGMAQARFVGAGRDGENPLAGFEDLPDASGYIPHLWSSEKFRDIINSGAASRKQLAQAYVNGYSKIYTSVDIDDLRIYAEALVNRFTAQGTGGDVSILSILRLNGSDYLRDMLVSNGMSTERADRMIKALAGDIAERGKIGSAKKRMDIDPRTPIPGTDLRIMDLLDTDLPKVYASYSRRLSGAAALARHEISLDDIPKLRQAWVQEAVARGDKTPIDKLNNRFDSMMSYFTGGALSGGVSPIVMAAKRLTNAGILNGIFFPQMAETGGIIAASGVEAFTKSLPDGLSRAVRGGNPDLMQQLQDVGIYVGYDHLLHNPRYAVDAMSMNALSNGDLVTNLNNALGKVSDVQGYVTGFNQLKQAQQVVDVTAMIRKVTNLMRSDNLSPEDARRLYSIWGDDWKKFQKYFQDGGKVTIDGDYITLNLKDWDGMDVDTFARGLHTHADQSVQRARAGESTYWHHTDWGALMTHLVSYPLTAFNKQFIRVANISDEATRTMFLWNMGFATSVVLARDAVSGKEQEFEPLRVMNDAFSLSNMTGWAPMMVDPVASMLGLDDLRFNRYNTGASDGVLRVPPVFSTLNRMAHAPMGAVKMVTGTATTDDIYAVQATPLVGNAIGFNALFNTMKNNIREENKAKRAAERKVKQEEKQQQTIEESNAKVQAAEDQMKSSGILD